MKQFVTPSYTFTPGASGVGTLNLFGIADFNARKLVAVINQTRGVVIYSTGGATTRYTALSGTLLTLNVDTSTHSAGDALQVIYEQTSVEIESLEALEALRMAIQSLTRTIGQSMPDTAGRQRVLAENPTAAAFNATMSLAGGQTLATLATLSNQTQIGGLAATEQVPSLMRLGADSMRRNISVS
jgi:hypothetical protein